MLVFPPFLTSPLRGEVGALAPGEGDILKPSLTLPEFSGREFPLLSSLPKVLGLEAENISGGDIFNDRREFVSS